MAAQMKKQAAELLLLLLPFFLLPLSCQVSATAPAPSPGSSSIQRNRNIPAPVKKALKAEILEALGVPPVSDTETADWTISAAELVMEKLNWPYNVTVDEEGSRPDAEVVEDAALNILAVVEWIVSDRELNPFRSLKAGLSSFVKLFRYVQSLEEGDEVYGGEKNPVYRCFKLFYPRCEARLPESLVGALVFRFECSWEFYDKCRLEMWAETGRWDVPDMNSNSPPAPRLPQPPTAA